ncbi:hypothetical protein GF1_19600 [Desulfolithobacter dissulfuricans]|uniref:Uncharacterized protein n=1 Tax=Desulfolithobacter dissulfuricans TaxID=2795293 RepID=A0A915U162_9BACT|nr:hypothetical protein [Desulfolithobacter dissulfuricans]BCO09584.1 hypothetical protein GF1_19600 [Desulfolithobacter dissulfuricans]
MKFFKTISLVSLLLTSFLLMPSTGGAVASKVETVAGLGLGIGDYILGRKLTAAQMEKARDAAMEDAYPGTIKFMDGGTGVVAAERDGTVLALYHRNEKAGSGEVKAMIVELLDRFGEPTTMAHDKMIYWAWNKDGKISEDQFNIAKKDGSIKVLATVKFASSITISNAGADDQEPAVIYYIISSDPLLQEFMQSSQQ